jgi:hypothetical protein
MHHLDAVDSVGNRCNEFAGTRESHYLAAKHYGFSIPDDADIDGIEVKITRRRVEEDGYGPFSIVDYKLELIKADVVGGDDNADTSTNWSESFSEATYGGSSDLCGRSWTAADINDQHFGVALRIKPNSGPAWVYAEVDAIEVIVHYTTNDDPEYTLAATGWKTPGTSSGNVAGCNNGSHNWSNTSWAHTCDELLASDGRRRPGGRVVLATRST